MVERSPVKRLVVGSCPTKGAKFLKILTANLKFSILVLKNKSILSLYSIVAQRTDTYVMSTEPLPIKQKVAGSNPANGTIFIGIRRRLWKCGYFLYERKSLFYGGICEVCLIPPILF